MYVLVDGTLLVSHTPPVVPVTARSPLGGMRSGSKGRSREAGLGPGGSAGRNPSGAGAPGGMSGAAARANLKAKGGRLKGVHIVSFSSDEEGERPGKT